MSGPFIKLSRKHWLILTLVLPVLLLFWQIIFAGRVLFWGVPMMQFVPWYQAAVDAVRASEWPLWNPLVGNGAPLLANYQVAVFYPPNWLHLIIPPARAMSWLMVLHVVWAGLGMLAFLRALGLRRFPSLVGALSFGLSGYLISRLGFASIGSTLPWLPWLLWAAERLLRKAQLDRGLILGLCLGLQWLAGHAQTSFYSGLALGGYLLWRWWQIRPLSAQKPGKRRWWCLPSLLILAGLIGLGLAAVQLLPTAELQQLSQRSAGVETGFAMTYSLWPLRVISFFTPRFFGHPGTGNYWGYCCNYWEDNGYVGFLPLLLALGAVWGWIRRPRKRDSQFVSEVVDGEIDGLIPFFGGMALFSVVLAFGVHTPVFPFFFEHVPGFGQFQAPARLLCLWSCGISVLAGIGAQKWRPTGRVKQVARYGIIVGLAFLIAAAGATQMLVGQTRTSIAGVGQLGVILLATGCLALYQPRLGEPVKRSRWVLLTLLFVGADLVLANWGGNPTAKAELYSQPTASAAALREAGLEGRLFHPADDEYTLTFDHYLSFENFGPSDTAYWHTMRETLLPNMAMLDGLPAANNFDPLRPVRHEDLMTAVNEALPERQVALLQMMGVKTLVSEQGRSGLDVIHSNQDAVFSAVPDPMPRAFAVYNMQRVNGPAQALELLLDPSFDPRAEVLVEGSSAPKLPEIDDPPSFQALALTGTNNTVTIWADLPADAYVVLLDSYYPGWQATADDEPVNVYPANSAFRAVPVPAGEHEVVFSYRPLSFQLGLSISVGVWLLLLGVWSVSALRKRK